MLILFGSISDACAAIAEGKGLRDTGPRSRADRDPPLLGERDLADGGRRERPRAGGDRAAPPSDRVPAWCWIVGGVTLVLALSCAGYFAAIEGGLLTPSPRSLIVGRWWNPGIPKPSEHWTFYHDGVVERWWHGEEPRRGTYRFVDETTVEFFDELNPNVPRQRAKVSFTGRDSLTIG